MHSLEVHAECLHSVVIARMRYIVRKLGSSPNGPGTSCEIKFAPAPFHIGLKRRIPCKYGLPLLRGRGVEGNNTDSLTKCLSAEVGLTVRL